MVISPNFPALQTRGIKGKGLSQSLASKVASTGMERGKPVSAKERAYMHAKSAGQRTQESLSGGLHSITEAPAGLRVGGTHRHNGKGIIGIGASVTDSDNDDM